MPVYAPQLPAPIEQAALRIARQISRSGGRAYWVGGCVRDGILGIPCADLDIEVFGLSAEALRVCLAEDFKIAEVGVSFGIFKLKDYPIDIGLPRRESKSRPGHKGFAIQGDPNLTLSEAAARRDFTLNALYYDPLADRIEDPYNGLADLQAKTLRHTSPAFAEDPLRVLRGMQFVARFNLTPHTELLSLCQRMEMEDLPRERQFEEWRKLLLQGVSISRGLDFLKASGWLRYYPELEAMDGCPQNPQWHPEGDVYTHTGHCLDAFAQERLGDPWEDLVVGLGVLCHDMGKPATTHMVEGRITSPGHDVEGEAPARRFLARITRHTDLVEAVIPLVLTHMLPNQLYSAGAGDAAIRRLARRVERIDRLVRLVSADMQGSPPKIRDRSACDWLLQKAAALAVVDSAPEPIVQGRHLIELGEQPGAHFKGLLETCYEAQLEGAFHDLEGGRAYLRALLSSRSG